MIPKSKVSILNSLNDFMREEFLVSFPHLIEKWLTAENQKKIGHIFGLKQREVIQGPQRNISAYLFFCESKRKEILDTYPGIKPNKVMILFGECWRQLSEVEKAPFIQKAQEDRERYNQYLESRTKNKKTGKPSTYNLFCTDERRIIREQNPSLSAIEIRKELGRRWKHVKETNPELLKKYGFVNTAAPPAAAASTPATAASTPAAA